MDSPVLDLVRTYLGIAPGSGGREKNLLRRRFDRWRGSTLPWSNLRVDSLEEASDGSSVVLKIPAVSIKRPILAIKLSFIVARISMK